MAIMKYIKKAFGVNGDLTVVPDDIQSDGSVSYDTGWTDLYQRNPATDPSAKRISRAKHNQLFYDITSNTKLWQEQTFPDWIADKGDGIPFAYGKDAMVRYLDDFVYVSLEYNNTDVPSASSKWVKFEDFVKLNINSLANKTTPIDTDNLVIQEAGGLLKKLSFANLKLWILSLFNPSLTGTVSFNSTTNNISLTNIVTALGLEIGDVIKISGAEDAKNNSEFTVEVITDNDNVIVNQAHANKGTSKNIATRASDTGVTVKLLAKWYNAPIGLGQDFVSLTGSRTPGVTYPNNTKRALFCVYGLSSGVTGTIGESKVSGFSIPNIGQVSTGGDSFSYLVVPNNGTYSRVGASVNVWLELR